MIDPDETLQRMREMVRDIRILDEDPESMPRVFADRFEALDAYLALGGRPPKEWESVGRPAFRPTHAHEAWQIRMGPKGRYCAACGGSVASSAD